jgi:hypothetical protein
MSWTPMFLIGAHVHAAGPAPLGSVAEVSGFLLVLLTTVLIVAAVERAGRR